MQYTFPGGIHPKENKITKSKEIIEVKNPKTLVIPMGQHIGAPAKAIVNIGDEVKPHQKIGESVGFVSSNIYTPLGGKVTGVGNFLHPMGHKAPSVVIEVAEEQVESIKLHNENMDSMDKKRMVEIIGNAGIVGMGGATFPAQVKLSPPPDKKIEYVILNGAECEPYLTSDHRVMLKDSIEIIEGLKIMMKVLDAKEGYIGIEQNKPDAIKLMKEKLKNSKDIKVIPLTVKYPQGAEKQLIYAVTQKEVPSGGLPMDVGAVVHNVATSQAVYRALKYGEPLVKRVVTLTGSLIKNPGNYMIPVGTLVSELVELVGGLSDSPYKVISGGPMMGLSLINMNVPITKGASGILFLSKNEVRNIETTNCISCGSCIDACPMRLIPRDLAKYSKKRKHEEVEALGLMDCVECGSCAYVCPSGIPLVHTFKTEKGLLAAWKKSKKV
jgi:electron transport complex protein RnfC